MPDVRASVRSIRALIAVATIGVSTSTTNPSLSDVSDAGSSTAASCPSDMLYVPSGRVQLGGELTANPTRVVNIAGFCIDKTEVSESAYASCANRGGCTPTTCRRAPTMPVRCVDAQSASRLCASLGRRLPSWDEWEYAARGWDRRWYPWGRDAAPKVDLHTVGQTSVDVSPFGVLDLGGNVSEWTATTTVDASVVLNSVGGGSWRRGPIPIFFRMEETQTTTRDDLGFRCAK